MSRTPTLRDPLWGNIRLDEIAAEVVDARPFQKLRGVKQLGFTSLVYPGAVHTRFLHAVGVYHLVTRTISEMRIGGHLQILTDDQRDRLPEIKLAALLHDIGHRAFSHALEELSPGLNVPMHEDRGVALLGRDPIRSILEQLGPGAPGRIADLIRGRSDHPLQGLVSGSLDLDKIDYLRRDSLFCGVPYGAVDFERLVVSLTLARPPERERAGGPPAPVELAVAEKGIGALETVFFSKYRMFRNVYWHHAVRAATGVFVRLLEDVLRAGLLGTDELEEGNDEAILSLIKRRLFEAGEGSDAGETANLRVARRNWTALERRALPKRVLEVTAEKLPETMPGWPSYRPDLLRRLERRLEREWGREPDSLMMDYPGYPDMLGLRLLLVRRHGAVRRITTLGERGLLDLPRLGHDLHRSARVFRVFSFSSGDREGGKEALDRTLTILEAPEEQAEAALAVEPVRAA